MRDPLEYKRELSLDEFHYLQAKVAAGAELKTMAKRAIANAQADAFSGTLTIRQKDATNLMQAIENWLKPRLPESCDNEWGVIEMLANCVAESAAALGDK